MNWFKAGPKRINLDCVDYVEENPDDNMRPSGVVTVHFGNPGRNVPLSGDDARRLLVLLDGQQSGRESVEIGSLDLHSGSQIDLD